MINYYEILGVSPTASLNEIKERYRYLAFVYHPDRFIDPIHKAHAEEDFRKINEAYDILSHQEKRAIFDKKSGLSSDSFSDKKEKGSFNKAETKIDRYYIESLVKKAFLERSTWIDPKVNLKDVDISDLDLSGIYTQEQSKVQGSLCFDFANSDLQRINLSGNYLYRPNFSISNLSYAIIQDSEIYYPELSEAIMIGLDLSRSKLSFRVYLNGKNLSKCIFKNTVFIKQEIIGSNLCNSNLTECYLSEAILDDSNISNSILMNANLQNISANSTIFNSSDLSFCNLAFANLKNAKLRDTKLCNTKLIHCDLSNADLSNCDLSNTDLFCAKLYNANLKGAVLSGAKRSQDSYLNGNTILPDGSRKGFFNTLDKFIR
jgi:uncharacterized protein YjbI with pentapeptide repeats